ncbi:glucose-6-phosphate isomerase [Gammaproteobacteria bacterium 45_16_T64]|nr:glucose-6-phosphate isomerase [Gammaproteobacteria bacterium 45_16_T64]
MDTEATPFFKQENLQDKLKCLAEIAHKTKLVDRFNDDASRFDRYSLDLDGLLFDYSKNHLDKEILDTLIEGAKKANIQSAIEAMFSGEKINITEDRAVLHTALRAPTEQIPAELVHKITEAKKSVSAFSAKIRNKEWLGSTGKPLLHIVNIGIGGSDLGPAMAVEALSHYAQQDLSFYFVSNIDPTHICETLAKCDPETTLFIISSKSFSTLETLSNAKAAKQWLIDHLGKSEALGKHFIGISANVPAVNTFGIPTANILPMWDWVGGRYSLWSAIGLALEIAIGTDEFTQFLAGGHSVDNHLRTQPLEQNIPVLMALISAWNSNFMGADSNAVVCYEQYLHRFVSYLQQMDMESNGKGVQNNGQACEWQTAIPLWGGTGSDTQHSYHQLFHQGSRMVPLDFIVGVNSLNPIEDQQAFLFANCLAQSQALMAGKTKDEATAELLQQGMQASDAAKLAPHKTIPGNRPSNLFVYKKLTPFVLGQLVALYEQKVFVLSALWNINAFDQWGVELGKQLSNSIKSALIEQGDPLSCDSSTAGLINHYRNNIQAT